MSQPNITDVNFAGAPVLHLRKVATSPKVPQEPCRPEVHSSEMTTPIPRIFGVAGFPDLHPRSAEMLFLRRQQFRMSLDPTIHPSSPTAVLAEKLSRLEKKVSTVSSDGSAIQGQPGLSPCGSEHGSVGSPTSAESDHSSSSSSNRNTKGRRLRRKSQ